MKSPYGNSELHWFTLGLSSPFTTIALFWSYRSLTRGSSATTASFIFCYDIKALHAPDRQYKLKLCKDETAVCRSAAEGILLQNACYEQQKHSLTWLLQTQGSAIKAFSAPLLLTQQALQSIAFLVQLRFFRRKVSARETICDFENGTSSMGALQQLRIADTRNCCCPLSILSFPGPRSPFTSLYHFFKKRFSI